MPDEDHATFNLSPNVGTIKKNADPRFLAKNGDQVKKIRSYHNRFILRIMIQLEKVLYIKEESPKGCELKSGSDDNGLS